MKIGILGASTMGRSLIQHIANCGFEVLYYARSQKSVDAAREFISAQYDFMISRGWLPPEGKQKNLDRIQGTTDMNDMAEAEYMIEAVVENLEIKKEVYSKLDKICRPDVILATNTSSLSITEIASATERPEKVIGMHFFNPATVMKLVEIIPGYSTSDETVSAAKKLAAEFKKTPIEVAETPGFVVNRMLVPMINEAIGIYSEKLESAENIDKAMQLGANHPMGPLALADLVGLDICLSIMETLHREFGDDKYRPHPLLRKMVRARKLGVKTGEGFYTYNTK